MAEPAGLGELQNAELDDILSLWHSWAKGHRISRGFNNASLVCGQFRISRQYDDANGKLDADLEDLRCRQVDHEVRQMADPHRTAIYVDARNLCTGLAVWDSPRLPRAMEARAVIVKYARLFLVKRLVSAGVMDCT